MPEELALEQTATDSPVGALINQLNDDQRRAALHGVPSCDAGTRGPLAVLAGPGTGKTRTIIARLAALLDAGADPSAVVGLTFTVKAAGEMRERLAETIGRDAAQRVFLGTFHSFGRRVLSGFGDRLGLRPEPELMDSAQASRMLRSIIAEHSLFPQGRADAWKGTVGRARKFIEQCRSHAKTPQDALKYAEQWRDRLLSDPPADDTKRLAQHEKAVEFSHHAQLFAHYERACIEQGVLTFDDFLSLPIKLLREHETVAALVRTDVQHVVVDEFQDVNGAQIEMLKLLCPPKVVHYDGTGKGPDVCVVGDDDQAIYSFRGADPKAFAHFSAIWGTEEHPVTTVQLSTNYRSEPAIVSAAQHIIDKSEARFAPDKVTQPDPSRPVILDGPVEGITYVKGESQGRVIAAHMKHLRAQDESFTWSACAVVARTNNEADSIAAELAHEGVPVDRHRKVTPLDDMAVGDLLAWMRLAVDPTSVTYSKRVLVRPPRLVPAQEARRWEAAYLKDQLAVGRPFLAWLSEQPDAPPAAAGAWALLEKIAEMAPVETATKLVEYIARESGVTHAEPLANSDRAVRVKALVQVLLFVRAKQTHLEQPGTIEQFLAYYDDLDKTEQQFSVPSIEMVDDPDGDEDREESSGDAVSVVTAHKSKGLEFDTVYLPKVRPRGYPAVQTGGQDDSNIELPGGFLEREEVEAAEEERRIFYVACTRAERKLVLLAQERAGKSRSTSAQYFDELQMVNTEVDVAQRDFRMAVRTDGEVFEQVDADGPLPGEGEEELAQLVAIEGAVRAVEVERTRLRHEAMALLHEVTEAGAGEQQVIRAQRELSQVVRAMHATSAVLSGNDDVEAVIAPLDAQRQGRFARLQRVASGSTESGRVFEPMTPPLTLSYTMINSYQRCPLSFYIEKILGLEDESGPQLVFGKTVHSVLEDLYKQREASESEGQLFGDVSEEHIREMVSKQYELDLPHGVQWDNDVVESATEHVLNGYVRMRDDAQAVMFEQRVEMPYTYEGVTHKIIAKIDRIDQLPDGRWRIVDYKTGRASKKLTEPGDKDLQLGIYAMALPFALDVDGAHQIAASGGTPHPPAGALAAYWLTAHTEKGEIALGDIKLDKVRESIDKVIAGMLKGEFPQGRQSSNVLELIPVWEQ